MKVELNMFIDKIISPIFIGGWGYLFSSTTIQLLANGNPELNMIEQLFSLGVGGVVAALVLWWKRQDDKEHREEMQKMNDRHEERISDLINKGEKREERMISALEAATDAISSMSVVIDRVSSRADLSDKMDKLTSIVENSLRGAKKDAVSKQTTEE